MGRNRTWRKSRSGLPGQNVPDVLFKNWAYPFILAVGLSANGYLRAADLPFANGILSPQTSIVFVAHEPNGIDAIEIDDGGILWHSNEADRPLVSWDSKLLAFKSVNEYTLTIVALDPRENGALRFKSAPIVLPTWCSISSRNNSDFATSAKVDGNLLVLEITASGNYRGGANPPDYVVNKFAHRERWTAKVNLMSGIVTLSHPGDAPEIDEAVLNGSVSFGSKRFEVITVKKTLASGRQTIEKQLQASDTLTGEVAWRTAVGSEDHLTSHPKLPQ